MCIRCCATNNSSPNEIIRNGHMQEMRQTHSLLLSSLCCRRIFFYARREKYRAEHADLHFASDNFLKGKLFLRFRRVLLTGKGSASQIRKLFPAKKLSMCALRCACCAFMSCRSRQLLFIPRHAKQMYPSHQPTNRPTSAVIYPSISLAFPIVYFCLKAPK